MEDFKAFTSKPANFANIQNMTQGSVLVHFDNLTEPAESFHIELIQGSDYQLGSPSIMKVIILDRYQGKVHITCYNLIYCITFLDTSIGFKHSNYTINEEDGGVFLEVQRSGNLSFSFTIKLNFEEREVKNATRSLYLPGDVTFQADKNSSQVLGYFKGDSVYQGTQHWGKCCLVSEDYKQDNYIMKFSMQCIDIIISDEEDCKFLMNCFSA